MQKAQDNFEQAQQEVMQAQTELEMLIQEHASCTRQREPGENLGGFDGDHGKFVEPRRRPTTRKPGTCNPGVEANPLRLSRLRRVARLWTPSSKQDRIPSWTKTTPRSWQTSRRRMLQVGRRSKQRCNTPITPPPKKTRTAAPADASQSGAQSSQAQRLSARAMMNFKDTELLALSQRACAIIPALASSRGGAPQFFASSRWFAPAHTRGDTAQLLTRRAGIQARDR